VEGGTLGSSIADHVKSSERLAHIALPAGWERRTHTLDGKPVCILVAKHPADVLSIPLNASGWQEIHVGLFRPNMRHGSMQVRLSTSRFWRRIRPMQFIEDPGGALQDGCLGVFHLEPDARLLVRTEPLTYACVGYVDCKPATAPHQDRHKRNVGVVFDVNMVMSHYRIDEPDDLLAVIAPYVESDFSHIFWGTGVGSYKPLYFSDELGYHGQTQTKFMSEPRKMTARVMRMFADKGVDPLRLITDFAQDIGLRLWANDRISKNHESDFRDDSIGGRFLMEHRDKRVMESPGVLHHQCAMSFAYPEIREMKVRCLAEQARYGVDGIYIDFMRKYPIVGWEPAVLDSFKAKHGCDPQEYEDDRGDWRYAWLGHGCGFVTRFMRDLRASLDEVGREIGKRIPVAVQVPGGWHFTLGIPRCYFNGLDVETWAREGLVDIVAPSASDCLWHEQVSFDRLGPLLEGTNCRLWGALGQQVREGHPSKTSGRRDAIRDADAEAYPIADLDPWRIARTAADMYNQGADGIYLWEAHEVPCVLQRWDVLKNLGNREWLNDVFGHPIGPYDGRHVFKQTPLE